MKPILLILSTEAVAEVLHDEHALSDSRTAKRDEQGRMIIPMWKAKIGKPEHSEECDQWRRIADKFTEHLMQWVNASGMVGTPCVASGSSATQKDAVELSYFKEKSARLEDEVKSKRHAENELIRDRDRLIQQLVIAEKERDAALDSERQLSQRLANIASLTSGF